VLIWALCSRHLDSAMSKCTVHVSANQHTKFRSQHQAKIDAFPVRDLLSSHAIL
jgi:hypothetical protein